MTRSWLQRLILPALFLVAAAVWLAPVVAHPDGVAFWRGGKYSDVLISHLPNALWLRQSIVNWHQFPLWNPMILSGAPFAADPLSGLWYLPNWLVLFLPPTFAFNLLMWLHLAFGGWGLFLLLSREGVGTAGSLLAGLLFSGTPKWVGHVGLGHVSLVSAVAWMPWCLLAADGAAQAVAERRRDRWAMGALAGVLCGVAFLADPRWSVACAGLTIAYGLRRFSHSRQSAPRSQVDLLLVGLVTGGLAATMASALAIPLGELTRLTTRASLSAADREALSLPPVRILGVVFPDLGGWPEWMAYAGVVALLLAILAIGLRARSRVFWSAIALVGWVLALGDATPLYTVLGIALPVIRIPARFLLLSAFAVCVLAGWGLQRLSDCLGGRAAVHRARLLLAGGTVLIVALAAGFGVATGEVPKGLVGVSVLAVTAATWGIWSSIRGQSLKTVAAGWILLAVVDLAWVDMSLLVVRSRQEVLGERRAVADALATRVSLARIFSPSYSLPQQAAAQAGLQLAEGVSPLQLADYVDFMASATGFTSAGYNVTLPPFPDGDPTHDWGPRLDAQRLGLLNVGYVVSEYEVEAAGLAAEGIVDGAYLYQNEQARPRAWVQASTTADVSESWRAVQSLRWSPNRIEIEADGPGFLVLSEVAYPGWRAFVDGELVELQVCDGLLRCLALPTGSHEVLVVFRPIAVYLGVGLTAATLLLFGFLWRRR